MSLELACPGDEPPPRTAEELYARLGALGLRGITHCRLTQNRAVMVSYGRRVLRVHRGFLDAPREVLEAIVCFVCGRTRAARRGAQRVILQYPVSVPPRPRSAQRAQAWRERPRPGDERLLQELAEWHRDYNRRHFAGALRDIAIRISSRMRSRLGQYSAASSHGEPAEIAIGRAHIRRHGWAEVLHTLLHEMVHQWQAESGHPIDHGRVFRQKAREIGIAPVARRQVRAARVGRIVHPHEAAARAARKG